MNYCLLLVSFWNLVYHWVKTFLASKMFCVGYFAELDFTGYFPQGSVFGLLLFLLFNNILASALKSPKFADDVYLVGSTGRGDSGLDIRAVPD